MSRTEVWPTFYLAIGLALLIGGAAAIFQADAALIGLLIAVAGSWLVGFQVAKFFEKLAPPKALLELEEQEPQVTTTLARLTRLVNSTLEINQVLNLSLEQLARVLAYDAAYILLHEETQLRIAAYRGPADSEARVGYSFPLNKNQILRQVLSEQQPRLIEDTRTFGRWPYDRAEAAPVPRSWLGAPLLVRDESIGLLIIEKNEPNFYDNKDELLAMTFADQIATAVQNAQLFDSLRHKALEVAVMADNLAEEKSKLDVIIRHIADGLVVTDAEGTIQLVNPAFEQMLSRPTTTLADRSLTHIEEIQRLIAEVLANQEQVVMVDIPLSDGRILKASSALIQEEKRMLGVVTVLRDVTREREVDRMKSEFISTVSHELRTPLTSVLGFARHINKIFKKDVATKVPENDRKGQRAVKYINEELEIIINEGERLTRLINDVLDIAKMEAGKLEWHMAEVSIEEIIQQAVTATSALARAKNLPIQLELKEHLPTVWADADRLIQVVTNLLSNAIKFTDRGQVIVRAQRLHISDNGTITPLGFNSLRSQYTALLQPGHWLAVSVEDTGIGISDENLPYVFEKFKQVGDVLTNRPEGTGLGIPICKEIVEQHGGRIWADSQLNAGSTFTFALPLEPEAMPKPLAPEMMRRRVADTLGNGKRGQLILVVDDEVNIRSLLRQELSEAGYQVIEAIDGLEALTKARQEKPDLIILDVMMPGLNGFDVTSILKSDQATLHIPILILSIVEDRERGFRLGAEDYLTKPLETDRLLHSIGALLERARRGESHRKVLVIDEDVTMLTTISNLLEQRGCEVIGAHNSLDGLKKAEREKPDLIVLNTPVLKMNNHEILNALRHESGMRDAPVIMLTNTISPEEVADILEQSLSKKD